MSDCDRNPYPGPKSFEEKEAEVFFGREQEVAHLGYEILANSILLIYGPSGVGKTSLIGAGLVPWLKKNGVDAWLDREGEKKIPIISLRQKVLEGIDINKIDNIYVALALNKLYSESGQFGNSEMEVICSKERSCQTLVDGLAASTEVGKNGTRVLFIDQFEEFFDLYDKRWNDRQGFFEQISDAIIAAPDLRIIFVLREDYLARMDDYANFLPGELEARYHLKRLAKGAALDAIVKPSVSQQPEFAGEAANWLIGELQRETAKHKNEEISEENVGEAVEIEDTDVSEESIDATILQVVCHDLWDRACRRDINSIEEQWLVGENRDKPLVEDCLTRHYTDALNRAAKAAGISKSVIAEWMEKNLTQRRKRRAHIWAPRSEFEIPSQVIDDLEDSHVIRCIPAPSGDDKVVDLMHDRWVGIVREACNTLSAPPGGWKFESEDEVEKFINMRAYFVSHALKKEKLAAMQANLDAWNVPEIENNSHIIGEVHFCLEVLDGRAKFLVLQPESYDHLVRRSFENAKSLKAYYIQAARQIPDITGVDSYYEGCRLFQKRALDTNTKVNSDNFEHISNYIRDKRLAKQESGWSFYGNIGPAVKKGTDDSCRNLQKALGITPDSIEIRMSINCFQAAIVMYFLPVDLIKKYDFQKIF